jgi:excisionase family DNA binding protein
MPGLMLSATEARRLLGFGEDKFRRLVKAGVIPSWRDPDTGWRHYPKPALEQWAARSTEEGAA